MKPYLAIIGDSLREALASRVLWVLVVGITIVLLAIAPLSYRTDLTTRLLSNRDFYAPQKLALKIRRQRLRPSPAQAIWERMSPAQQGALNALAAQGDDLFGEVGGMRRALNAVIAGEVIYDEQDWNGELLLPEAERLLRRWQGRPTADGLETNSKTSPAAGAGELDAQRQERLNRLLIEGAFPEHFRSRPDKTVTITYAMLDFPRTWLSEDRLLALITELVLPAVTNLLLGVVAVLIALLVTSTIIPEMFSPGTLHLLLSKPLSRSLIFLSRFFGACCFVLINITYLLVGLWLILGSRFGVWNAGLLKCIPLFLFLFIVYYSVAAVAGAYWKNAIVAVSVAAALWGVCFVLGVAKEWLKGGAQAASLRQLLTGPQLLMGVSENDEVAIWSDEDNDWSPVFDGGEPLHGPLLSSSKDWMVASSGGSRIERMFFGGGGGGRRPVTLAVARAASGWSRESLANAPTGTAAIMLDQDDQLLVLARDGVHQFQRNLSKEQGGLFGFSLPLPAVAALSWKKVAEPDQERIWQPPLDGDCGGASDALAIYSRGRVLRFDQQGDGYRKTAEVDLTESHDVSPEAGAAIRWHNRGIAVAVGDGKLLLLDEQLQVEHQSRPSRLSQPRMLAVSPDGRHVAVLMKNGKLLLSSGGAAPRPLAAPHATTVALRDDEALIGTSDRSVISVDLKTGATDVRAQPPLDNLQRINRWIVQPLATVLPMPSELGNTAQYLLSGKETSDSGLFSGRLDAPYAELDPWTPVVRCCVFVAVMLSLGCWYIERQEF